MKDRIPRILVALVLCAAMLLPTFALAESPSATPVPDDQAYQPSQPCEHLNKVPVTRASGYYFKYDDENVENPETEHAIYAEMWIYNQCQDCGLEMSGRPAYTAFNGTQSHMFGDGVCSQCGYVCQHPDTYPIEDYDITSYQDNGSDQFHTAVGTVVKQTRCGVCDKVLAQEDPQPYSAEQTHWYHDGICQDCGHACAHSKTYQDHEIVDGTRAYTDNGSDESHTVNCTREIIVFCSYCDKELSRTAEPYTYSSEHDYVDGKCADCGHVCAHSEVRTRTKIDYSTDPTYADDAGDRFHTVTRDAVQFVACVHCGTKLSGETPTRVSNTEQHSYNEEGACMYCGHIAACPHANTVQRVYSWLGEGRDVDTGDNHYHTYEEKVQYRSWCQDCQQWIGESTEGVRTYNYEHNYDRSGVCEDCGHVNTCAHANVTDESWFQDHDVATYRDIGSDEKHIAVRAGRTCKVCADCGISLTESSNITIEDEENHDYGADGVCKLCGHVNACAHVRTHKDKHLLTTTGYAPIDAQQHTRTGMAQIVLVCDDCGMELQILSTETYSQVESHEFIDGACYQCGYLFNCKHPNLQKNAWLEMEEWENYTPINSRLHLAHGYGYYDDFCPDCGQTFYVEGSGRQMTQVEPHYLNSNGVCMECGYKSTCAHENLSGWTYTSTGRATYKNIGHRLVHQATPVLSRMVYCLDCGEFIEDSAISSDPILEYHDFNSEGVCVECGFVNTCAHANTRTNTYLNTISHYIDTGSDSVHDVVGKGLTTVVYCTDCNAELSRTVAPTGRLSESHDYIHGICTDCGHVNQCKHANTETTSRIVGTVKDTGDNATHLSSGYRFERVVCKDCGETISSKLVDRNASEKVAHKYVDDLCVICGHVKTAESEPSAAAPSDDKDTNKDESEDKGEENPGTPMVLVYESVSEDTEVNGVKVADHPALVDAMSTIGENLDGDDVTVEIPNIEKVLTADEKARFDKLTVRERLMVALSALGFHDMVKEAAAKDPTLLSEEALALVDEIAERLANMSEAELSALAELLAEVFPKETIVIDGKEYTCFSVDLVIERNGEKSYERYTFRQEEDDSWVLARIELGEYKPADEV